MNHYRAYARPNDDTNYRIFGLGSLDPTDKKYSKALREACKRGAGPRPLPPPICSWCSKPARFLSNLCYKFGIAGAYNMICSRCQTVHIPKQWGPSEDALKKIEAIRDADTKAREERKWQPCGRARKTKTTPTQGATSANDTGTQVRKTTKKPTQRMTAVDDQRVILDASHQLFAPISNKETLGASMGCTSEGPKTDGPSQKSTLAELPFLPVERVNPLPTIEVVMWIENDRPPVVEHVERPDDGKIYLEECESVRAKRGPVGWERFDLTTNLWALLPFSISCIDVELSEDVIFIRVWDVRCRQFGEHLHRYQVGHGSASPQELSIIKFPPMNHVWVIVWGKCKATPDVHLFNLGNLDNLGDEEEISLPWMHLLQGGLHSFCAWHHAQTSWQYVTEESPFGELGAPIVLLAHPEAARLAGSGEAIAMLERWTSLRARASHLVDKCEGSSCRVTSRLLSPSPPKEVAVHEKPNHSAPLSDHEVKDSHTSPKTYSKARSHRVSLAHEKTSLSSSADLRTTSPRKDKRSPSEDKADLVQARTSPSTSLSCTARDIRADKPVRSPPQGGLREYAAADAIDSSPHQIANCSVQARDVPSRNANISPSLQDSAKDTEIVQGVSGNPRKRG